jgi:hypothetical protein
MPIDKMAHDAAGAIRRHVIFYKPLIHNNFIDMAGRFADRGRLPKESAASFRGGKEAAPTPKPLFYWNNFIALISVWMTPSVSGMPTKAQASTSCQVAVPVS